MKDFIEEFTLTIDTKSNELGKLYEELGLDVVYDTHSIKVCSSSLARIISINEGIHVHTLISGSEDKVIYDTLGNKVIVTFLRSKSLISVGIITSGGDAPGMNSAIRAIVRICLKSGGSVYGVYRGFDGLINDYICKLGWDTETHNSNEGGTVLLSFRSKEFYKREGRKRAVFNLIKRGINSLIVLGGDGSLKGALILKNEWRELFRELLEEGKLDFLKDNNKEVDNKYINDKEVNDVYINDKEVDNKYINNKEDNNKEVNDKEVNDKYIYDIIIIGIPASIDNDISLCDFTLGCDTALNRVVESIDHLSSTMKSHQRVFVIEVMGRKCGWLSLMAAYSCLADYLLIPEDPPLDWRKEVLEHIEYGRKHGKPGIFIIVSEGALDRKGNQIDPSEMVDYIKKQNIDVRLLKLGHVQRGGPTSASDRILGTLSGIRAFKEIEKSIKNKSNTSKIVISSNGDIITKDLTEVINQNDIVKGYENNYDFKSILKCRGDLFRTSLSFYLCILQNKRQSKARCLEDLNLRVLVNNNIELQNKYINENTSISNSTVFNYRIGILQCGKRSSGMNTALNSVIQYCYACNIEPMCICNGLEGFMNDSLFKPEMYEFGNEFNNGGTILGLGVAECDIKKQMKKHNLKGLIIIGDEDSLEVLYEFKSIIKRRKCIENNLVKSYKDNSNTIESNTIDTCEEDIIKDNTTYSRLNTNEDIINNVEDNLSIILIPSSSINNIPMTDYSIGSDTALNTILKVSDCAKLSSLSLRRNVFVLEIAGVCGYLTCMSAIAACAFDCFIPERKYLISHLSETAHRLRQKFKDDKRTSTIIFRNEKTFCSISTESFCKVLETDGLCLFDTDYGVLGRLQEGLNPSPMDRINASLLGFKAVDSCKENNIGVVGIQGNQVVFTDIDKCMDNYDNIKKRVKDPKWFKFSNVCKLLE